MFMRAAAAVQLILGIGFWTGRWTGLVPLHQAIGSLYVIALWIIAGVALKSRRIPGPAAFAVIWGLFIAVFGMAQLKLWPGDMHWIVRVLHLAIALAAMPMAERLARATGPASPQ